MNRVLPVLFMTLVLLLVTAGVTSADITPVNPELSTTMPPGKLVQGLVLLDGSAT